MMQKMIFGVGPNPMIEEDGMGVCHYVIYVTDEKTWKEENCCNDQVPSEIFDIMGEIGFYEDMEGVFSSVDSYLTEAGIISMMESKSITYNEPFSKFMQSTFDE